MAFVKQFRCEHAMTAAVLASILGVNWRTLQRWERRGPTRQAVFHMRLIAAYLEDHTVTELKIKVLGLK
jgi:DNA-binding transcriptional regulator YiaG